MKKIISMLITAALILCTFSGCSENTDKNSTSDLTNDNTTTSSVTGNVDYITNASDMFSSHDVNAGYSDTCVTIQLNGDSAVSNSDSVKINGTTITITEEATYIITGKLNDGMIIVNADENSKPQLVLNNANINSETSAAIYILEADKVFLTLEDNTSNTLSNGGTFTAIDDNNIDATIFSKTDLTFNGNGNLKITSPSAHGIVCKDDLIFTGGKYTINSTSHAVDANDSIRIKDAAISVVSGKDGLHCENSDDTSLGYVYISSGTVNVEAEGDAISASSYLQIEGGTFELITGGGSVNGTKESSDAWGGFMGGKGGKKPPHHNYISSSDDSGTSIKGLKATTGVLINNGTFTVDSADDAVHSNGSVMINGGTFDISTGDDGFHADETLTITNGTVNITESYEGLEALNINLQGGNISLFANDDGINAAGGSDLSGINGGRDAMFGGEMGINSSSKGSIIISGGTIYINASGDGIDANGSIEITGGHTTVCGPTNGDTATLDYDISATIKGGTFIGTGAYKMAQTFSDSQQGVIAVNAGTNSAGTKITVNDSKGNNLLTYSPELSFQIFIYSSPELQKGESYTLTIGSASDTITAS